MWEVFQSCSVFCHLRQVPGGSSVPQPPAVQVLAARTVGEPRPVWGRASQVGTICVCFGWAPGREYLCLPALEGLWKAQMSQSLQPLLTSLKLPSSSHWGTAHTSLWLVLILPVVSTISLDSDLQLYISSPWRFRGCLTCSQMPQLLITGFSPNPLSHHTH